MKRILMVLAWLCACPLFAEKINIQIVYDCSSSMGSRIEGQKKSVSAVDAFRQITIMVNKFQKDRPNVEINLGIVSFRGGNKGVILPLQKFNRGVVLAAIDGLPSPDGNTPLGEAFEKAYDAFPEDGSQCHIFVLTDGEENGNVKMADVMRSNKDVSKVYFVAFDVDSKHFYDVKTCGAMITKASNATELNAQVSTIFTQNILLEKED